MSKSLDASLRAWDEIKDHDWSGLLIGNGASMAIWQYLGYKSLFEEALNPELDHSLSDLDQLLFEKLETTNFESALSALQTARLVGEALGIDVSEIDARREAIRLALISAVRAVHVPWLMVPDEALVSIRECMSEFSSVYTTNYNLLFYWAIMQGDPKEFPDYFWDDPFDISNTEVWRKATRVLFLHGAIHLYHDAFGGTVKRTARAENLLDAFGEGADRGETPLFVAEGTSSDKVRAIRNSDYLTFAYKSFSDHVGDLVLFGSSLAPADAHLVHAMRGWDGRTIAASMRSGYADAVVIERKARLQQELPQAALIFFDAATFPLGSARLQVEPA